MNFPHQLCDRRLRFYKASGKLPLEKGWNRHTNYQYDDPILKAHLAGGGNYGVVTGRGGLVVLDFDDKGFFERVASELPPTFTVVSAGKRLPHLYYFLKGGGFRKVNVRDGSDRVLCDVQADGVGIIGPGSVFAGRSYDVAEDREISLISADVIKGVLGVKQLRKSSPRSFSGPSRTDDAAVLASINALVDLGVQRLRERHFKCPFHPMQNFGNLHILDDGAFYCFHEQAYWRTMEKFKADFEAFEKGRGRVLL